ncbi:MAPEG family protein [Bradyrhizobium sp.]|uniref:MAPEG family protein n=1 Tax=Bradyrhizobium sp. TaxID=376 RepID=UPI0040376D36
MPYYTAIVSLLAVAVYFFFAARVAVARGKFGVKHPATTGNPDFERVFRAHINTLEWMPTFLVPLWICAVYFSDRAAAVVGLVWVAGRILYFFGYSRAVEKRVPGFLIQALACLVLIIGAIAGIVRRPSFRPLRNVPACPWSRSRPSAGRRRRRSASRR